MEFSLKKQGLVSFVLFFILINLLVVWPILFGPSNLKYFSFIYLLIGIVLFPLIKIPYTFIKRTRIFFFLILINFIALFAHFTDPQSVVNISALVFSYLALYFLVIGGAKYLGYYNLEETIFKSFLYILLISLLISPILTLFKWSYAPPYYPWEALFSNKRLLLVIGKNVGHSDSMWLMAFSAAFVMRKVFFLKQKNIWYFLLLILLFLGLIATKSRTALLFIVILFLGWLSYYGIISKRLLTLVPILGVLLFFTSIFNPLNQAKLINIITSFQEDIPSLRIVSSLRYNSSSARSIYSGRDILNLALYSVFTEHPWFGAGDSDPIFLYGVDNSGNIAYVENKVANSETMMRMLAKYGVFYFLILTLFIITPLIRASKGYYMDNVFVISICAIILISGLNGTIFENLYSISGLFTILILYLLVMPPYQGSNLKEMRATL